MKKQILALLLGLLLFSVWAVPAGIAENASGLYYLWDIPFGISESEFIEQAYAKTGFNFVPHSGEVENYFKITTDENQSISFLGHPLSDAKATFQVDVNGNPSYYMTSLIFGMESQTISESLSLFDSIRLAFQKKYGDHTFAMLTDNKGKLFTCDAIEGGFDTQQVIDILTSDNTINTVMLAWKNLALGMAKSGYDEVVVALFAGPVIQEESEPLEVYQNRNAPSDAGL